LDAVLGGLGGQNHLGEGWQRPTREKLRTVAKAHLKFLPRGSAEGAKSPLPGALGVSPRFLFLPLSLDKGEGDRGVLTGYIGNKQTGDMGNR
jgi:hypothetical protein